MKYKNKILTFLIAMVLMWNLAGSSLQVYGSDVQSEQEQEEINAFHASVTVQDVEENVTERNKVVLKVHAENKTERNEIFRVYFGEIEGAFKENKDQWKNYLKNPSQKIDIQEFKETDQWPVSVKIFNQGETERILKQYKELGEGGNYYIELEFPADACTDFSLTVTSEEEASIVAIPAFGKENFIYGEAAVISLDGRIKEEANQEKTFEEGESIKTAPEICKFRTCVPQKGGVLNIQYEFEEAQWTTVYPKKNGYATADILPGGGIIHTVFAADPGHKIKSGRILSEDGHEIEVLDDCVGKKKYEYDVKLLEETITLEVTFAPKEILSKEEIFYQESLDFIYHRDSCVQVLENSIVYQSKLIRETTPEAVKLDVGEKILYPSQLYHTREFYISGCDGVVGIGYCMQPNKKNPSSGWYYDIESLDEARQDYANAYKLAMLTNYGLELQELGHNWFGKLDQGNKMYRQIYIHSVIGYLETGSLLGLTGPEQGDIIKIANEIYATANSGKVSEILKNYRIYAINGGISSYQDICFMIRTAKGGLSIQKTSLNPEFTENNQNYSLAGAVYGIYKDALCTKEIMSMTTNENGYGATADDVLEEGIYYVKEKIPSPGYLLDTQIYTYEITGGITARENQKFSKEPPKRGRIELQKTSAVLDITNGNDCYSLDGAEYVVYKDKECTETVTKIVTDFKGKGVSDTIPLGEYYIKETKAPEGYEKNNQIYTVSLKEEKKEVTIVVMKVQDYPGYDKMGIRLVKMRCGEETAEMPTLEGTQFTIKYYDGYYSKENLPATAKREWVIEIKKEGDRYEAQLSNPYLAEHLSDDLYKDLSGQTILPYGTITIQETKPAVGYTLNGYLKDEKGTIIAKDGEIFVTQVTKKGDTVKVEGGNQYTAEDMPMEGSIKIKKFDTDGTTPLKGTVFEIKNGKGEIIHTAESNNKGEILFEKLKPDTYTITERKTAQGHTLLKEPLVVRMPARLTEQQIEEQNIDKNQCIYDPIDKVYYIYHFVYEITNHANFQVPMTGGESTPGVFFPMVAGLVVLAGTIGILMRKKEIHSF